MKRVRTAAGHLAILLPVFLSTGCTIETSANAEADPAPDLLTQMTGMLENAAAAWNAGDLDVFMDDYDRAPETSYIGSQGFIAGWEAIRSRYAPLFEPGAARDSLRFESVRARALGADHALATARYVLFRDGTTTASGPFTLVLVRTDAGWRIIHDQSASDPPPADPEAEPPQ